MQEDNDIIEKLISLPHYRDEVGDDYHAMKESKIYKLWVRPTILYQLQCE